MSKTRSNKVEDIIVAIHSAEANGLGAQADKVGTRYELAALCVIDFDPEADVQHRIDINLAATNDLQRGLAVRSLCERLERPLSVGLLRRQDDGCVRSRWIATIAGETLCFETSDIEVGGPDFARIPREVELHLRFILEIAGLPQNEWGFPTELPNAKRLPFAGMGDAISKILQEAEDRK